MNHQSQLTLILGGARSGKSTFAQQLASASVGNVWFVATAEARDDDMARRITQHQVDRLAHWRTIEEPLHVAYALMQNTPPTTVLLDCVTLWVSNLLLQPGSTWEAAQAELDALLEWHRTTPCSLIVVSNEVGLGIVPADALSRTYREWLGRFNQQFAAAANDVLLMVAGLPIELRRLAVQRT